MDEMSLTRFLNETPPLEINYKKKYKKYDSLDPTASGSIL